MSLFQIFDGAESERSAERDFGMNSSYQAAEARERFRRSVTRAQMADLIGLATGAHKDLVSFDEVAGRLRARQQIEKGTEMVPLMQIIGSVGRYRDFTRTYLPRAGVNLERWTRLDAALNSMEGFPPVDLFKIGEVYFVRDGNHRVSVARANGSTHIEAYVTEIQTDIPLTLDDFERDRWLIKIEHKEFLEETRFNEIRPEHGIAITEPGRYAMMLDHITVHQYLRNQDLAREGIDHQLSWEEAVASWYDTVYMPVVDAIRDYGLLEDFPTRTEADLYLWVALHRERLALAHDLAPLDPATAVATFAQQHGDTLLQRTFKGLMQGLHRVMGDDKPLGMSEEEYREARQRHHAGERTLAESEIEQQDAAEEATRIEQEGEARDVAEMLQEERAHVALPAHREAWRTVSKRPTSLRSSTVGSAVRHRSGI
jgi:hypothetical protein